MDADDWLTKKFNETFKKSQKSEKKEEYNWVKDQQEGQEEEEEGEEEEEEQEEQEEGEEGVWDFLGKKDHQIIENGEMSQSPRQKEKSGETTVATPDRHVWFGAPTTATIASHDKKKKASIGGKKTTAIKKKGTIGQRKAKTTTPSSGRKSKGKEKRKSLATNRTAPAKRKSTSNLKIGNIQGSASTIKKGTYGKNNGEKITKAIFFRCEVNVHMV